MEPTICFTVYGKAGDVCFAKSLVSEKVPIGVITDAALVCKRGLSCKNLVCLVFRDFALSSVDVLVVGEKMTAQEVKGTSLKIKRVNVVEATVCGERKHYLKRDYCMSLDKVGDYVSWFGLLGKTPDKIPDR